MTDSSQHSEKPETGRSQTNRSISRAVRILECVAGDPAGRTAKEIALAAELALPTAYHLVGSLVESEMLVKSRTTRRYLLGPRVGLLAEGLGAQMRAPQYMLERLELLADRTMETAYLAAWRENDAVITSIIEGRQAVRVSGLHLGYRGAAHSRATGKVLLAFAPEGSLATYMAAHDLHDDDDAAGTASDLRAQIDAVRHAGYAVDEAGYAPGVACIAAPIGDGSMAIAVSMPIERYTANRDALLAAVLDATRDASVTSLSNRKVS
jgi:DNA-binding IclR family transcriptional regulator